MKYLFDTYLITFVKTGLSHCYWPVLEEFYGLLKNVSIHVSLNFLYKAYQHEAQVLLQTYKILYASRNYEV